MLEHKKRSQISWTEQAQQEFVSLFAQLLFFSQNVIISMPMVYGGVLFQIMCVCVCIWDGTILFILGSLLLNVIYAYEWMTNTKRKSQDER